MIEFLKEVGYSVTLRDWNWEEIYRYRCSFLIALTIALIFLAGIFAIFYCAISLKWWTCQVDNLIVILGIALAATSVRSARPFPITDPCHFNHEQQINKLEAEFLGARRSIYLAGVLAAALLFFVLFLPAMQGSYLANEHPKTTSAFIGTILFVIVIVIPFWYAFVDYYMTKQTVKGIRRARIRRAFRNQP